nr:ubiquitin-specific protease 13 [Tanacetum cinerariifolium]
MLQNLIKETVVVVRRETVVVVKKGVMRRRIKKRLMRRRMKKRVMRKRMKRKIVKDEEYEEEEEEKVSEEEEEKEDVNVKGNKRGRKGKGEVVMSKGKKIKVEDKEKKTKGKGKGSSKPTKKVLSDNQIRREKFLSEYPPLLSRTVSSSFVHAIRDAKVNMKSFIEDIGFSALHSVNIDTLPNRLARFVVRAFYSKTYNFYLKTGVVHVTAEKVHEILGLPIGGISLYDLPERREDDEFVQLWLSQFAPKKNKRIFATDIAEKLVRSTRGDFMFIVNFLMLFANVMGKADTMRAFVNLSVVRCIREDTNIAGVDWGEFHSPAVSKAIKGNELEFKNVKSEVLQECLLTDLLKKRYMSYISFSANMAHYDALIHRDDVGSMDLPKDSMDPSGPPRLQIMIPNLPLFVMESGLYRVFNKFGKVKTASLVKKLGIAHVEMKEPGKMDVPATALDGNEKIWYEDQDGRDCIRKEPKVQVVEINHYDIMGDKRKKLVQDEMRLARRPGPS